MTLADYLKGWAGWSWNASNCAHFALGWAAPSSLDGVSMPYNAADMRRALREAKARTLAEFVTERLGEPIKVSMAQVGDVVMYGRTLGLCNGRHFVAPSSSGLLHLPMTLASLAWRRP